MTISDPRGLLTRWTPVVVWMGVLFLASAQPDLPGLQNSVADTILKKSGHAAGYAVLALLILQAIRRPAALRWSEYAAAIVLAAAYALTDEFHQSFVPGRNPSLVDVLIDTGGAAVGCAAVPVWYRIRRKPPAGAGGQAALATDGRLVPALLLCLVSIIWGGSFIAARIALREMSSVTLASARFAIAAVFFLGLVIARPRYRAPLREMPRMIFFGLLAVTFYFIFQYNGVERTSASLSAIVVTLSPLAVVTLSVAFLGERLSRMQILGIAMATMGAAVLVTGGYLEIGGSDYWAGIMFLVLNVLAWAVYNIIGKRTLTGLHPTTLTSYMMITGGAALIPFALADGGWARLGSASTSAWASIGYLVVFATIVAYLAYNYALQKMPASQAGVFLYLNPVAAVIIANLMLAEPLTALTLVGGVLAIGGVYLTNRAPASPPAR